MKLRLHKDYPGKSWLGCVGAVRIELKPGEVFEPSDKQLADWQVTREDLERWLLSQTWRERERGEDGKVVQKDHPLFEEVTEAEPVREVKTLAAETGPGLKTLEI